MCRKLHTHQQAIPRGLQVVSHGFASNGRFARYQCVDNVAVFVDCLFAGGLVVPEAEQVQVAMGAGECLGDCLIAGNAQDQLVQSRIVGG
jgi:hypothetical protein